MSPVDSDPVSDGSYDWHNSAIGSVIAAIVCALVAATKGRNPFGWGILGLFFSILTLIVVVVIPSKK